MQVTTLFDATPFGLNWFDLGCKPLNGFVFGINDSVVEPHPSSRDTPLTIEIH
jgi:hypothetical protein